MVAIPPGATVMISDEAANNASILEMIDARILATAPLTTRENEEQEKPDQPSPVFNTGTEQQSEGKRNMSEQQPNQPREEPNRPTPQPSPPPQPGQPNQPNQPNQPQQRR